MHVALVDVLFLRWKRKGKKREKEKRKKEKVEWVSRLLSLTKANVLALWSKQLRKKTQFIDIREIGTLSKFQL